MIVRPYGPTAWLVDELDDPAAWAAGLRMAAHPAIEDIVPAERTVLVRVVADAPTREAQEVRGLLDAVVPSSSRSTTREVIIAGDFDGDDLGAVAAAVQRTPGEVVALLVGAEFTVAFCGFSPGFAYLRGLPEQLHLPRRDTPRTSVPAGSIAIAAHYAAVYPSSSPGGWHLLGRTELDVWDPERADPALLRPGTRVRFEVRR